MLAPIYPPSAAAPLLFLALEKIARTPTSRLRVGYHVTSRYGDYPIANCVKHDSGAAAPRLKSLRPLGQALYLDRLPPPHPPPAPLPEGEGVGGSRRTKCPIRNPKFEIRNGASSRCSPSSRWPMGRCWSNGPATCGTRRGTTGFRGCCSAWPFWP